MVIIFTGVFIRTLPTRLLFVFDACGPRRPSPPLT